MLYMIVRVKFQPAKEAEFLQVLGEYLPVLQQRYGWQLVSSLKTQIGDLHEVLNTWRFAELGDFWKSRAAMFADTDYIAIRARLHGLMVDEHLSFSAPLPYSPMQ